MNTTFNTIPLTSFVSKNVNKAKLSFSPDRKTARLVEIAMYDPNTFDRSRIYKIPKGQLKTSSGRFKSSLIRSRSRVREHIINNFPPKSLFITLTYADNFGKDYYDTSLRHFDLFARKLRCKYPKIKYLAVAELQKRGAIHYHMVIDRNTVDCAFLGQVKEDDNQNFLFVCGLDSGAWNYGIIFVKSTFGAPQRVAQYVSKYVTKTPFVEVGRKVYLISRNLLKSIVYNDLHVLYSVLALAQNKFNYSVDNEYAFLIGIGKCKITDFFIDDPNLYI